MPPNRSSLSMQRKIAKLEKELIDLITQGDQQDQDARRELLVLRGDLTSLQHRLKARAAGDPKDYEDALKQVFDDEALPTRVLEKQARFCLTSHKYEIALKQIEHVKRYEEIADYLRQELRQQTEARDNETLSLLNQISKVSAGRDEIEEKLKKIEEQTVELQQLRSSLTTEASFAQSPLTPESPTQWISYSFNGLVSTLSPIISTPISLATSKVWTDAKDALESEKEDVVNLAMPTIISSRLHRMRSSRRIAGKDGLGGSSHHSTTKELGRNGLEVHTYHVRRPVGDKSTNSLSASSYHEALNLPFQAIACGTSLINAFAGIEDENDGNDDSFASTEPASPDWFGSPASLTKPSVGSVDPSTFGSNFDKLWDSEEKDKLEAPSSPTSAALRKLTEEVYTF